jgi:predicted PurR-regulated permease PerM
MKVDRNRRRIWLSLLITVFLLVTCFLVIFLLPGILPLLVTLVFLVTLNLLVILTSRHHFPHRLDSTILLSPINIQRNCEYD